MLLQAHLAQICLGWTCEYKYKTEKILHLPIHVAFALSALLLGLCCPLYPYLCGCKVYILFLSADSGDQWMIRDAWCDHQQRDHTVLWRHSSQCYLFRQWPDEWSWQRHHSPMPFFFFTEQTTTTNPRPQSFKRKKTLQGPLYISIRVHGNPSIS